MSKLDDTLNDLVKVASGIVIAPDYTVDTAKQRIKEMVLEMAGDMERRETEDMALNSWTPEDYKAFGRNELRIELIKKLEAL